MNSSNLVTFKKILLGIGLVGVLFVSRDLVAALSVFALSFLFLALYGQIFVSKMRGFQAPSAGGITTPIGLGIMFGHVIGFLISASLSAAFGAVIQTLKILYDLVRLRMSGEEQALQSPILRVVYIVEMYVKFGYKKCLSDTAWFLGVLVFEAGIISIPFWN